VAVSHYQNYTTARLKYATTILINLAPLLFDQSVDSYLIEKYFTGQDNDPLALFNYDSFYKANT